MKKQHLLAAVDLGSNSLRLLIARVEETSNGPQVYALDKMKELVRLAANLDEHGNITPTGQEQTIAALQRFNQRLEGFEAHQVRAIATNTLRVAKNAAEFLPRAEAALGFPIDIVAGREEARLIYIGAAHSLPLTTDHRLIIDIGGGSTEFIIGQGYEPRLTESLDMGCVTFSNHFFPNGQITKERLKRAELAAQEKLQGILQEYRHLGWQSVAGTSGTARALADICQANQWFELGINRDSLEHLKQLLLKAEYAKNLKIEGLKADRLAVMPGGFAIMSAIFKTFDLNEMAIADGALRLGSLYDLLGRTSNHDMRDLTCEQFQTRYVVDVKHANQISQYAQQLFQQTIDQNTKLGLIHPIYDHHTIGHFLHWAASLHEIGLSIAHEDYHKHSAYILEHADMPGFSTQEQTLLAQLILCHLGKIAKIERYPALLTLWPAILCLRLAVLLCRSRVVIAPPPIQLEIQDTKHIQLTIDAHWLTQNPLSEYLLQEEMDAWQKMHWQASIKTN